MQSPGHDIALFVRLVLTGWEQYAEAGVTGLLIYIIEKILRQPLSWKILKWVAVSFLIFAFFNIWRDQYRASEKASAETAAVQKQLDALSKPIISGEAGPIAASYSGEKKENCLLTLLVHIRNLGAPTGIENPSLVITKDGKIYRTEFLPPSNASLYSGNTETGPSVTLRIENHLFPKAMHNPIMTNVAIDPWLQAVIFGLTRDELDSKGTIISLSFHEVATGTKHTLTYVTDDERNSPIDLNKLSRETH